MSSNQDSFLDKLHGAVEGVCGGGDTDWGFYRGGVFNRHVSRGVEEDGGREGGELGGLPSDSHCLYLHTRL